MHISLIPQEIIDQYHLEAMASDGWVYTQVEKGMYGLAQAGILMNKLFNDRLAKHGYYQSRLTPCLWRHHWQNISFALVVDNFGIKYTRKADVDHLIAAIKADYKLAVDWEDSLFCRISLEWNYTNRVVRLSMPGYIKRALHRFQHVAKQRQGSPHKHVPIVYEKISQEVLTDRTPPLLPDQ